MLKKLFLLFFMMSASYVFASTKPFWTCYNGKIKYEVDWKSPELETESKAYVFTKGKKVEAYVDSMTDNSPDIVFFDPNYQLKVILILDTASGKKEMYRYEEGVMRERIAELSCKYNY